MSEQEDAPRIVTTEEELDTLPNGAVILDDLRDPLKRIGDTWHYGTDYRRPLLPVIVLWEPSQ